MAASAGMLLPAGWGWAEPSGSEKTAPDVAAMLKEGQTPNQAVRALLKEGMSRWSKVKTLEVTFTRRELLDGKTERGPQEVILLRERTGSTAIYMKWLEGPGKDREISYIPERDRTRFVVTPGGALRWVVVERELDHADVKAVSRHSPAEAGMGHLLGQLEEQFRISEKDAVVTYVGEMKVDGRACYRFFRFLPEKSGPDGQPYYCWKLDLCMDKETCLPVSVKCYGWKRQFDWQKEPFEEYYYTGFTFDGKLDDNAFLVRKEEE